jgi:hypothetical protein
VTPSCGKYTRNLLVVMNKSLEGSTIPTFVPSKAQKLGHNYNPETKSEQVL